MGQFLETFKSYLAETSAQQRMEDWKRVEKWNEIGPDAVTCLTDTLNFFYPKGVDTESVNGGIVMDENTYHDSYMPEGSYFKAA